MRIKFPSLLERPFLSSAGYLHTTLRLFLSSNAISERNPRISPHVFVCDAAKEPTVFCFFSTKPWVFFLFSLLVCEPLNTFASSCGQISIIHVHTGDYNDTRSLQTDKPAPQFIRDLSFSLQTRECPLFSRKRAKTLQSSLSSPG